MKRFDVAVLGAGAAGMMCAIEAGRRGRSVIVLEHAAAPGEKIRISGGGRCNFTNLNSSPAEFLSANPSFCISALSRYRASDFVAMVDRHGIAFHEKTLGQLFCDGSSVQIINLLTSEMGKAGAELELGTAIEAVEKTDAGFRVRLSAGEVEATSLILATGGKSIPKMGATNFGYRLAEQFGLAVTETRPALVPLTFEPRILERLGPLSGIAVDSSDTGIKAPFITRYERTTFTLVIQNEGFLASRPSTRRSVPSSAFRNIRPSISVRSFRSGCMRTCARPSRSTTSVGTRSFQTTAVRKPSSWSFQPAITWPSALITFARE